MTSPGRPPAAPPPAGPAGDVLRPPAERRFAAELAALAASDAGARPPGWRLSPRAVRTFLLGSEGRALPHRDAEGRELETVVTAKFLGDDALVERAIVTLAGSRALLLVGEPGTAKSMLSELLAAAISGTSTLVVQGTAGTTEDQIRYSWNYARLLAEGPSLRALVPAPLWTGLREGRVVRFEEITRCPPEVQDTLVSVLSDKALHVPELEGEEALLLARPGFNLVATANLRDRGVHEMSSALKRRFNFETVRPIADREVELDLVLSETRELLAGSGVEVEVERDVLDLLVTTFHDLRSGETAEGTQVERPTSILSTAEAVAVAHQAALEARWFGEGRLEAEHVARQIVGTVLKENPEDRKRLRQYFDVVAKARGRKSPAWKRYAEARRWL